MSDQNYNPDPLVRHPLDKRVLRLELAISRAGLAPILSDLPHVAGSARM
jgi:hypothetical protein